MARKYKAGTTMKHPRRKSLSVAKLDALIEEAAVGAREIARSI